ncbi:MAG TPA: hypothetical protein VF994_04665 [Myxococcales bacterium]
MQRTKLTTLVVCSFAVTLAVPDRPATAETDTVIVSGRLVIPVDEDVAAFDGDGERDVTVKGAIAPRSSGGEMAQRLVRAVRSGLVPVRGAPAAGKESRGTGGGDDDAVNVQVNDPALDHIVTFDPAVVATRPFEFSTQSETSAVRDGKHVVVGYNSSAGTTVQFFPGFGLAFTRVLLSGFSTSHDGGRTWSSGFVPPVSEDAPFTLGDPALAIDRRGNVFYASLGTDAVGRGALIINKKHGPRIDVWHGDGGGAGRRVGQGVAGHRPRSDGALPRQHLRDVDELR